MKKIVILDSHYRTRTFLKAFEGIKIFLVSVNNLERKLAKKKYKIEEQNILNLSNYNEKSYNIENLEFRIKELEKKIDWKLNDIINSDRRLQKFQRIYAIKYLLWIEEKFDKFIRLKQISENDIIFLEPTWAHEILISQISNFYNFEVWAPLKSKLIPNTFYFFKDWKNEVFFDKNNLNLNKDDIHKIINKIISDETSNQIKDFKEHSTKNTLNFYQIYHFFRLIKEYFLNNRNKHIHNSIIKEFYRKFVSILRFYYLKIKYKNFNLKDINDKKIIYFPLHYQPEASIDVIGYNYRNQLQIVKEISNNIKNDEKYLLLIKEHPHCVGNNKLNIFDEFNNISNIKIISPWTNSKEIIKMSKLVITIAGTASLEASIMNVPSVTLVKMFFSNLMIKETLDLKNDKIIEIIKKKSEWIEFRKSNEWINLFQKIINCSFNGNFGDPMNNKDVLNKDNITKLKKAIKMLI